MGDRSRFPPGLDDDEILTLIVGRINRTVPKMSDAILRCLAQLPNSPPFVSDSHRDHLIIWRKTVDDHLDDSRRQCAQEIILALRKVLNVRASVDHALTACITDQSGQTTVSRRAPYRISAQHFRRLFTEDALPDKKEWPDNKKGIPVSYYGPQMTDAHRYHDKDPVTLEALFDLVYIDLPKRMEELAEVSQEAVANHNKKHSGKSTPGS